MRCEKCKKNAATVVMQQSSNGMKTDLYLCDDCSGDIEISLLIENIFNNFLSKVHTHSQDVKRTAAQPTCSNCGITFEEIRQDGILGCAICYQSFYSILEPLLINTHAAITHEAKLPKRAGVHLKRERDISRLRTYMQQAIDEEHFDRAAVLRDHIRRLDVSPGYMDNEDGSNKS